jgi:dephospho-CoA kinase
MINGRACTGKDTIADYLVEQYGFTKLFFAEGIYDIAYKYFNMEEKQRDLLQKIGDGLRTIKPDVWVNYTYNQSKKISKPTISDVRRENEYLRGIQEGFFPIRVVAKKDICIERAIKRDGSYPDTSLWYNESETGADQFDYYVIRNDGTLEELYQKIDQIMNEDHTYFIRFLKMSYT